MAAIHFQTLFFNKHIIFRMKTKLFIILFFFTLSAVSAQTSKNVNVTTAGTLSNYITTAECKSLTQLTVTGNIDARDFAFMRDKLEVLTDLDLSGSTIRAYQGTLGTVSGYETTYNANEIPMYAFYNPFYDTYKYTLKSFKFPNLTSSIGYLAFYYCSNLSGTLIIPAALKQIPDYTFYGCFSLTDFSVNTGNTKFSSYEGVLFNKNRDTLLVCPSGKAGEFSVPTTVKHISASAFENTYNLTSITLSAGLKSIGTYGFCYSGGISGDLNLPSTLTRVEYGAFYGCWNLTGNVTIPASLTEIGSYCFFESNNLKSFSVSSSNSKYASVDGVFYSKNIDTLFICPPTKTGVFIIPSSVKALGMYAFHNCTQLSGTMTIPDAVSFIGDGAFYKTTSLSNFVVSSANSTFAAENGVLFSKDKSLLIACPTLKSGNYQMPESVREIGTLAFAFCNNLIGLMNIPEGVNKIGGYAFYGCNNIDGFNVETGNTRYTSQESVLFNAQMDTVLICPYKKSGLYTLPQTVKHIDVSAFSGCDLLTEVELPLDLISIGNYSFENCTGLTHVFIPQNVNIIGYAAFNNCTGLKEFAINKSEPIYVDFYALNLIDKATCRLLVPIGSKSLYQSAPYWKEFENIVETNFNTDISINKSDDCGIVRYIGGIIVNGLKEKDLVRVYNVNGQQLRSFVATQSSENIPLTQRGVVLVQINNKTIKTLY